MVTIITVKKTRATICPEPILRQPDRDQIADGIKETILSVKELREGFNDLPTDAPLFDDGSGDSSPVNLDSLDTLDVVMSIAERFEVDDAKLDAFLRGETDFEAFRTIDDIVEFILASMKTSGAEPATAG